VILLKKKAALIDLPASENGNRWQIFELKTESCGFLAEQSSEYK